MPPTKNMLFSFSVFLALLVAAIIASLVYGIIMISNANGYCTY
jgi:hypothetical protein